MKRELDFYTEKLEKARAKKRALDEKIEICERQIEALTKLYRLDFIFRDKVRVDTLTFKGDATVSEVQTFLTYRLGVLGGVLLTHGDIIINPFKWASNERLLTMLEDVPTEDDGAYGLSVYKRAE